MSYKYYAYLGLRIWTSDAYHIWVNVKIRQILKEVKGKIGIK